MYIYYEMRKMTRLSKDILFDSKEIFYPVSDFLIKLLY